MGFFGFVCFLSLLYTSFLQIFSFQPNFRYILRKRLPKIVYALTVMCEQLPDQCVREHMCSYLLPEKSPRDGYSLDPFGYYTDALGQCLLHHGSIFSNQLSLTQDFTPRQSV